MKKIEKLQFPPLNEQNDRIRIERFWARELTYFENLPLPEEDANSNDFRLRHYPPLLIHIFMKLYKIGTGEKLDEKHSLKLTADINGLFQKFGKNNEMVSK